MKRTLSVLVLSFILCSGFICTGSQIHKATLAEHDFKVAVQGFQNAEVAEFQAGRIDPSTDRTIRNGIVEVAQAGEDITVLLQKSDKAGALAEVNAINVMLQNMLKTGVLGVKNPATVANLEVALEAIQAVVTNIQLALS